MFRSVFSVILLFAFCVMASAQSNVDEKKREINRIKKNPGQYLYVEVVDSLEEVAVTKAQHYLQDEIDEFVEQQAKLKNAPKIVAVDMKKVVTMPRGNNRVRAFAYIKKSNIIAADNAVVLKRDANPTPTETKTALEDARVKTKRQEAIDKLLAVKRFADLESCLNKLKSDGLISQFGKQKTLQNLDLYVLVIYNRNGDIEAVLSEGSQRTNLATGQIDNISNYKERGAIGVMISK